MQAIVMNMTLAHMVTLVPLRHKLLLLLLLLLLVQVPLLLLLLLLLLLPPVFMTTSDLLLYNTAIVSQRLQDPLVKEYTFNYSRILNMI